RHGPVAHHVVGPAAVVGALVVAAAAARLDVEQVDARLAEHQGVGGAVEDAGDAHAVPEVVPPGDAVVRRAAAGRVVALGLVLVQAHLPPRRAVIGLDDLLVQGAPVGPAALADHAVDVRLFQIGQDVIGPVQIVHVARLGGAAVVDRVRAVVAGGR